MTIHDLPPDPRYVVKAGAGASRQSRSRATTKIMVGGNVHGLA